MLFSNPSTALLKKKRERISCTAWSVCVEEEEEQVIVDVHVLPTMARTDGRRIRRGTDASTGGGGLLSFGAYEFSSIAQNKEKKKKS